MYTFYSLILFLIICALTLIAVPFFKNKILFTKDFLLISILTVLLSLVLYHQFGQTSAVKHWILEGKNHYSLMTEIERLGGIDGIITRLQDKLYITPNDAKGWFILGKLYYGQHRYEEASQAFATAQKINEQSHL